EWVHVQLHQQKGMISLSPPTICNSAFLLIAFPCLYLWALVGRLSTRLLSKPKHINIFNKIMAIILLASVWWPMLPRF
ncbi:LysE family translocator, partial [Acinetobacter baumannii]